MDKNRWLEEEHATPIEAHIVQLKLLNHTKNRTPGHMLSNNALCLHSMSSTYYYFLVVVVNFDRFQILLSYTLLLQPPVLMRFCEKSYIPLYIV